MTGEPDAPETRRAIDLLKLGTSLPTPKDPAKRRELTEIATEKNSTIIFPVPLDLLKPFLDTEKKSE